MNNVYILHPAGERARDAKKDSWFHGNSRRFRAVLKPRFVIIFPIVFINLSTSSPQTPPPKKNETNKHEPRGHCWRCPLFQLRAHLRGDAALSVFLIAFLSEFSSVLRPLPTSAQPKVCKIQETEEIPLL